MTSTLNTLKSNSGSRKKKLRKGRGIAAGQGASCGFGMRGQKSRSGRPTRPGFEGGQMPLYRRVPKLKHFEIINQKNFSIINLDKLNDFKDEIKKTKQIALIFKKLSIDDSLLILDKVSMNKIIKASRNLPTIKVTDVNHFSAYDIAKYKKTVFTETSIKELEKKYNDK